MQFLSGFFGGFLSIDNVINRSTLLIFLELCLVLYIKTRFFGQESLCISSNSLVLLYGIVGMIQSRETCPSQLF